MAGALAGVGLGVGGRQGQLRNLQMSRAPGATWPTGLGAPPAGGEAGVSEQERRAQQFGCR